jgi:hypothetical protein
MKVGPVLILVLFTMKVAHAQARHAESGASTQSSLAVTATVEPSVWLVMEPDGKRDLVVANAAEPKESFSHNQPKGHRKDSALAAEKQTAIPKRLVRAPNAGIQFGFPTGSKQFEVTKTTLMREVSEGGKTERRPVMVTTVVPK